VEFRECEAVASAAPPFVVSSLVLALTLTPRHPLQKIKAKSHRDGLLGTSRKALMLSHGRTPLRQSIETDMYLYTDENGDLIASHLPMKRDGRRTSLPPVAEAAGSRSIQINELGRSTHRPCCMLRCRMAKPVNRVNTYMHA
jgi:hypothetical protein